MSDPSRESGSMCLTSGSSAKNRFMWPVNSPFSSSFIEWVIFSEEPTILVIFGAADVEGWDEVGAAHLGLALPPNAWRVLLN